MNEDILLKQLRYTTLKSQGLTNSTTFGTGKQAVLHLLEHLGYVQIDTLSVIARAHHHTLWSRIPDYQEQHLHQLIEERQAFEYWFHAASYLPMRDFRYALPQMSRIKSGESRYYQADAQTLSYVYDQIRIDGPKKARDFEQATKKPGSWWNWKPTKLALEQLFMQGDLMISGRDGMQKIYDLTERVLPSSVNTSPPNAIEFAEYLVHTYLRAYGFTTLKQITHLKTGQPLRNNVETVLNNLLEANIIRKVKLSNLPTIFALNDSLQTAESAHIIDQAASPIRLLSPFDNAIIHRERIQQLFNFDFRLECYTPLEKRQYGYFCLPILFGDRFIGRVDCKAHRKSGQFELIHLHIENTQLDLMAWLDEFLKTVRHFAAFNGCSVIVLSKVSPRELASPIKQRLALYGTRH